jgi:NTE family protein
MLFHTGALWRLGETGVLAELDRVSSVSGGSITAAVLGLAWDRLRSDPVRLRQNFIRHVVEPVRRLADRTIDVPAVLQGLLLPGGPAARISAAYRRELFGDATLQDLPDRPRFVFNATNMQSRVLWRFSKPYARDYQVGEIRQPVFPLAQAVAASSAFPPFLSPLVLRPGSGAFTPSTGQGLQLPAYTDRVVLTDGGVYDNLGLEPAFKRYDTLLVSDGGGQSPPLPRPPGGWFRHTIRVLDLVDHQVRSLRKRQLIDAYKSGEKMGTYWGIRTQIVDYGLADAWPCPAGQTLRLAEVPTRLRRLPGLLQERLINWGYAVCDAALRRHFRPGLPPPAALPYPSAAVGD